MDVIDRVRAFGRFYTTQTGLHARSFMGSPVGFSEARLLHELLEGEESTHGSLPTARDLARRLGLDEAYVSRTLAAFARAGWLDRVLDGTDARRRRLRLTSAGRLMAEDLRERSRAAVAKLLDPLPHLGRQEVAQMLDQARALLEHGSTGRDGAGGLAPGEVSLRPVKPGDAGWVLMRHAVLYAQEEGYDAEFEAVVAGILAGFLKRASSRERGWIAVRASGPEEDRLGCLFVVEEPDEPATCRLRLVLVEPRARGLGLGQLMLEKAVAWARAAGFRRMVLWTHESHRSAGRLYARNGFALSSATPARAFGQDVVDQVWERDL